MRLIAAGALLIALALFLGWYLPKEPSGELVWAPELAKTASAETVDGVVHLRNVRDWTYGTGAIRSEQWLDEVAIDPEEITKAWFIFEPFESLPAAGHTYLTFELSDGRAYSFSVEARKEADEKYSAFLGLFREYELAYTWGSERDFLSRRLLYLEHPVHMYPLSINPDGAQTLFLALVDETNQLATTPRFYNTLTANCTNLLAEIANKTAPGSVPYDLSWNLPGYSEKFLARIGFIPEGDHDLEPYQAEIEGFAEDEARAFSRQLRELPPLKNVPASDITE